MDIEETNAIFDIEGFIEYYLPGWLLAYTINYFCGGVSTIKAGAATDADEGDNFYDNDWVNMNAGKVISIDLRPLQKSNEDTCKECAFIAATCGMKKLIPPTFLTPSKFISLSLVEAMNQINVNIREFKKKAIKKYKNFFRKQ
ncbi:unnamed protein product [Blepharisma stoltei]|uniref:Uncharacterized protein n=1 Tax=Blepharisma stoltei TaxID=1481888 RepID=A0AAU9J8S2_9CILI|nr:unnamed protein product [Blepharisma stoltei]